ncbi:hypothetical protein GQ607_013284 [Colletotrichum asianum]|uniref:Uncharacterized protein n=1 Tax=Colletotrichum asianum TaxID=702518 RepID=A0A8H3ZPX5_9PEZI|nr:hypothetical protein GQ607_013284 [Colletotrichum asianum]
MPSFDRSLGRGLVFRSLTSSLSTTTLTVAKQNDVCQTRCRDIFAASDVLLHRAHASLRLRERPRLVNRTP